MNPGVFISDYSLNLKKLLIVIFSYLLTENIFSWLFIQNSTIIAVYLKLVIIFICAFTFFFFKYFSSTEKIYLVVFAFLVIKLILESVIGYGKLFIHFEIFSVLFPVVFALFVKYVLRNLKLDLLEFIAKFYLVVYIIFMVLYGREFSLELENIQLEDEGPFSSDTRIIHAQSIFMIIIPYLWFLNKYIHTRHIKHLFWFFVCFLIILLHQHRSVWSSAIFATLFYFVIHLRNNNRSLTGILKFATIILLFSIVSFSVVSSVYPQYLDYLDERFSDILNPAQLEGTGSFRIDQSLIYYDYFTEKPIFGWSFQGYELDNPLLEWWEPDTGQHFHGGFIEILFYHGIIGLIFKYSLLFWILIKSFSKKLTEEAIVLIAFCASGLLFSFAYVLPLIFWGHVGMCLFYIERSYRLFGHRVSGVGYQRSVLNSY